MKRFYILGLLLLCSCFSGCAYWIGDLAFQDFVFFEDNLPNGEDPSEYMKETWDLEQQGKYAEALERHIWLHENSKRILVMGFVRLSYALESWLELGDVYPPAKEAFIEMRDKKIQMLLNEKGDWTEFEEVISFNRYLDEEEKTLELFDYIDQQRPGIADECWSYAKDTIIEAKRYDLATKYMPDLMEEFKEVRENYKLNVEYNDDPDIGGPEWMEYSVDTFV